MAIVQVDADQCRKGAVIILDGMRHVVARVYVSKPDLINPYNSMVTIETDAGSREYVGHAKVMVDDPTIA